MVKRVSVIFIISLMVLLMSHSLAVAGNMGFGVHSGFGTLKYEEDENVTRPQNKAESTQALFLFGVSGEYSFTERYFVGITTDWGVGFGDREKWTTNGNEYQTNDMKVFAQFYDMRLGYKNEAGNFYYRVYASGGWDGLHFRRRHFVVGGVGSPVGPITEDFSLWRTGGGLNLGYKFGKWAVDGKSAYHYYFNGEVENSSFPGTTWDTNGTCMDFGFGVSREISNNAKVYVGLVYDLIELNQDVKTAGVFPNSTTEIIAGMLSLIYAF